MQIEVWQIVVAVAALICTVLLAVATGVVSVIGYFLRSWMNDTKDDLACLPDIRRELAVINTDNRHLQAAHNEFKQHVDRTHSEMWRAINRRKHEGDSE